LWIQCTIRITEQDRRQDIEGRKHRNKVLKMTLKDKSSNLGKILKVDSITAYVYTEEYYNRESECDLERGRRDDYKDNSK
jgi:hypothetical protein